MLNTYLCMENFQGPEIHTHLIYVKTGLVNGGGGQEEITAQGIREDCNAAYTAYGYRFWPYEPFVQPTRKEEDIPVTYSFKTCKYMNLSLIIV